jgi:Protein of unknown function (DUF4232)
MKLRSSAVSAACAVTAVLALGGCKSSATTASGSTASTAQTMQTAQTAGGSNICQASDLTFALGANTAGSGDRTQVVDMTNKGSAACTVDGFAGVDLVGTASGQSNYRWPLVRTNDAYSKVTLRAGDSAHFSIKYLPFAAGDGTEIGVTSLAITPPNTYSSARLTWSAGILLQDAATHPGTYITPITAGS